MNKNIIKKYEQVCAIVKKNNTEENKQKYIIIFQALDLQLNNQLTKVVENLSFTGKTLKEEIKRVDTILNAIKSRHSYREKMLEDYVQIIGYMPNELLDIKEFENENNYFEYKTNLLEGYKAIAELMMSGKKINELRAQAKKKGKKNKALLNEEADRLQDERNKKIDVLKNNTKVVNDLYDYCINAPFNELNAYIEYILIKINPKSTLKIKTFEDAEQEEPVKQEVETSIEEKPKKIEEEMPPILVLGSVKPTTAFESIEEAQKDFEDINLPTNGLMENTEIITINTKKTQNN